MPFNLSRRAGEAFEVSGIVCEIVAIKDGKVSLRFTSCVPFEVRYKEFTRQAKRDAVTGHNRPDVTIRRTAKQSHVPHDPSQ